ncbi:MAG: mechanosensitive ion channel family protein [Gemmataceae bacterium]
MMMPFIHDGYFWWALALVVGTPMLILILGEMITRLRACEHPLVGTLTSIRSFLLPVLAAYLTAIHVAEVDRDAMPMRVLLTLLYISVLNTVLALVNGVVFGASVKNSWQARMPKLVRDLARVGLVALGSGLALSSVWHIDFGSVFAALGVGSIVLGLALQEPLGNLFSGLMLTFERPFEVGDWIMVGDKVGTVTEVNWRAVHILTGANELQIIPNSSLAKNNFGNFSRPTRIYAESIEIAYSMDEPPNRIKAIVGEVVRQTPGVLDSPGPSVRTARYDNGESSIIYSIGFHVADYSQVGRVRDEILTRLWYASARAGLAAPSPTQTSIQLTREDVESEGKEALPEKILRPFRQFGLTNVEEIASHLCQKAIRRYAHGELVMREGQPFEGLFLILDGEASLTVRDTAGTQLTVAQLTRGDFFGEKSLLSCQTSDVTVTAFTDLEVVVLDTAQLHSLLETTPRLAREIGQVMETRRQAIQRLRGHGGLRLAA